MCRAAQGALTWALGIRVRPGNLWMGLFTLTVPRKQIHGQGCVSVGQDMCKIEGGFSLAVCESGSPAGHRGFADTPREMQLRETIFVLCTHTPTASVSSRAPVQTPVGSATAAPSRTRGIHLRVSPRAWMCINQHLSTVSIALYLSASIYLRAGVCISHNRYSEALIWWVKWSGLFDQPSGSITTGASGGAGITTYI